MTTRKHNTGRCFAKSSRRNSQIILGLGFKLLDVTFEVVVVKTFGIGSKEDGHVYSGSPQKRGHPLQHMVACGRFNTGLKHA